MFPASYVKPLPASASKRQKFLEDMESVRKDNAEKQQQIAKLIELKERLNKTCKNVSNAKDKLNIEGQELKSSVTTILESSGNQNVLKAKLEAFYRQLEDYEQSRMAIQKTRSSLVDGLQTLSKYIHTDVKMKTSKLASTTDALMTKLTKDETAARNVVDEKRANLVKSLTELQIVLKK
eukprot:TRINITY_DN13590_c0_g1_i1.p1 TRINITY_DN13590_c0_g1~~TRINITY_DN13590_c0_g1_i1.p1  ORF type:complete len:179 (-),score=28.67 TRINITY_DN13590_c0_g1_i1:13-549(-)